MPSAHLSLREEDVIRLSLEFLQNRSLHISQLSLERESGVINGNYSDDALFLRQLILDGQWDDALEFVQPLQTMESFENNKFHFLILKYKYFELLCIKAEAPDTANNEAAVAELVKVLEEVAVYAPSKEAHSQLCLYLTTPQLHQHKHFKDWNPSSARVECWNQVYPLVEKYLSPERTTNNTSSSDGSNKTTGVGDVNGRKNAMAKNDRLVQLMIKGLLYESCVEYCQGQATGTASPVTSPSLQFPALLSPTTFSDSDLSLLSWLHSIPPDTFSCPFEQRTLNVDVERLDRPCLEASWTEQLLVTPIKPKVFPHSAMPYTRPRATDLMSRSLNPNMDGLAFRTSIMAASGDGNLMSKSIASFHLTGKKTMNTSVDRLFDTENVFTGSAYGDLPTIIEKDVSSLSISKDLNNLKDTTKRPSTDSLNKPFLTEKNENDVKDDSIASPGIAHTTPRSHSPLLPQPQGTANHILMHHPLHRNLSANQALQQQSPLSQMQPKLSVPLSSAPTNKQSMSPLPQQQPQQSLPMYQQPYPSMQHPQQQQQQHHPQLRNSYQVLPSVSLDKNSPGSGQYNNNQQQHNLNNAVNNSLERAELFSIYQRRQQQMMMEQRPPPHAMDHYANNNTSLNANRLLMTGGLSIASDTTSVGVPLTSGAPRPPLHQQHPMYGDDASPLHAKSKSSGSDTGGSTTTNSKAQFVAVTRLEDAQAVRCAEFHPSGLWYAVGSNSKTLRVCQYPQDITTASSSVRTDSNYQPTVTLKRTKHHRGSIYCLAWSPLGDLLATASNDKTVKLLPFDADNCAVHGEEVELTMHDGTVRDLCFVEDCGNKSSLLISGGAGDCKIYVTDTATGTAFQALSGHTGHILSLYTWGGAVFVSGSQDRSVRFWDLRTRGCVNVITPMATPTKAGSVVASVCVDPTGRLLVSGHEDSLCCLYDIRGAREIQSFRPHTSDVRSLRFSPSAYYLLSAGYDNKLVLTDMQGDLTQTLPSVLVAEHEDKVISGRWHPSEFTFISTSADRTCTLWALPPV